MSKFHVGDLVTTRTHYEALKLFGCGVIQNYSLALPGTIVETIVQTCPGGVQAHCRVFWSEKLFTVHEIALIPWCDYAALYRSLVEARDEKGAT